MHVEGEIPKPDHILGLRPILKIDVEKARLYYDYERPDTLESKVLELSSLLPIWQRPKKKIIPIHA